MAMTKASSANARSRIDWNLAPGLFSRQRSTMRDAAGGMARSKALNSGGASFAIAIIVSIVVSPRNARWPVSIS